MKQLVKNRKALLNVCSRTTIKSDADKPWYRKLLEKLSNEKKIHLDNQDGSETPNYSYSRKEIVDNEKNDLILSKLSRFMRLKRYK